MENKLYVGNLSFTATEDDLRSLFSQAGSVKSATLVKDRESGRSRGFGFVEMESDAEAQKGIELFNGKQHNERTLTVNVARPREDRGGGGGGGGRGGERRGGGGGGFNRDRGNRW